MKNLFLALFFLTTTYSQQFHSLDGIEDEQGYTFLISKFSQFWYDSLFLSVYKFDLQSSNETKIIEAYTYYDPIWFDPQWKFADDFKFVKNDPNNFVNIGRTRQGLYDYIYLSKNDTISCLVNDDNYGEVLPIVEISSSNSQNIYYSTLNLVYRSFDGGNTHIEDSTINFPLISVADFNDRTFFGLVNNELVKSIDQGITFFVADSSQILFEKYFNIQYDINQFHIYRVNKTYSGYSLNVSNNKGNAFTWTKTYQSENPIFISIDSTQSGVVYLADGRKIYKSINNGYDFVLYKSLPGKLVGIYKKQNTEILYAASKSHIYKITSDSTTIIKSLPFPVENYGWFPLAVGNTWIYDSYSLEGISSQFTGTKYMKVVDDTLIENKNYFVIENEFTLAAVFPELMFLRIDSTTGFIYRYWTELDSEYIFHDLYAEEGDIVYNPLNPNEPFYYLQFEHPTNFLGLNTYLRSYSENSLCTCSHNLIKGFGLASTYFLEVYGEENILKGCLIDGVVYGDTTFVNVENEVNPIPDEYKLVQNYPNPFNPSTTISWQSPAGSWQTIKLYNAIGQEVDTIIDGYFEAGSHSKLYIVNSTLPSGIYFYQLKSGNYIETKKMLLIK